MSGPISRNINALLAGYSFLSGSLTGRPKISGMPVSISFELTNHCNLKCPECPSGNGMMKRKRGFMEYGLFERVMHELDEYLFYVSLYFQGEPMMHPDFFNFLEYKNGFNSIVSTNGHYLDKENSGKIVRSQLSKLIVSLDGMDQITYSRYRQNGDLDKVLSGIKNVADARDKTKSSIKLELQFLVNRYNEHQIPAAIDFAEKYSILLKLKSMHVVSDTDTDEWMPVNRQFRRYKKISGKSVIRNPLPNRCARLWFNPVVTWDGFVVPCCFDKNADYIMGDLKKDSFISIWNSLKYEEFRKQIFSDRKSVPICNNCTSGLKGVKY